MLVGKIIAAAYRKDICRREINSGRAQKKKIRRSSGQSPSGEGAPRDLRRKR